MAKSVLSALRFHNEEVAFEHVETQLWPNGPVCPHCGANGERIGRLQGKTTRPGLRKCYACRKSFTVRIGSIFEDSHLPLHLWLQTIHLMCASKKGISTRQLQRMLGCGMKTAWHLGHRIRAAMQTVGVAPMGGPGSIVEVDETYIGRLEGVPKQKSPAHKNVVLTLVERGGSARSFHVESTRRVDVEGIMRANIHKESRLMTDEGRHYKAIGREFVSHESVNHGEEEYVRGDVSTNTVENFYSVFKRGMTGVYQHCSEAHLHRYLSEFDFRYSNRVRLGIDDKERAMFVLNGMKGKRLTYETPRSQRPA